MPVQPTSTRGTTITTHPGVVGGTALSNSAATSSTIAAAPAPKGTAIVPLASEIHPLPALRIDRAGLTPDSLADAVESHVELIRRATVSMRADPASAPSYVRQVPFTNSSSNAAVISQTIRHGLGRPHTILHCVRSRNAAYAGFEIPNPEGQDPAQYATIATTVPGNTTAYHDFMLGAD